jgi:heme exporter protein C
MTATTYLPDDEATVNGQPPRLLVGLTALTVIAVIFGLYLALGYAETDLTQGDIQRIFYIHMPAFFGAFVAFGATLVGGFQYLRTREVRWDRLAVAGVEVGLALGLVNLVTGAIWARPIWNTWWTWDPRLTSDAVMILTYAAYLMLRNGIENLETRRRFAAVFGILAFITVLVTLLIIRYVPTTIHPVVIGESPQNAEGTFEATTNVAVALVPNLLIWGLLVPVTLLWWRIRLENRMAQVHALKLRLFAE